MEIEPAVLKETPPPVLSVILKSAIIFFYLDLKTDMGLIKNALTVNKLKLFLPYFLWERRKGMEKKKKKGREKEESKKDNGRGGKLEEKI